MGSETADGLLKLQASEERNGPGSGGTLRGRDTGKDKFPMPPQDTASAVTPHTPRSTHPLRVLIACEYSGVVRDAFLALGHDAMSCDLLPTEVPGPHYQGDVFDVLDDDWDALFGFPPCTFSTNAGVRWLYERPGRWEQMRQGAEFFRRLLHAPIPMICIENPVPHRYALEIIGRKYDQVVQPFEHGHPESKKTCLWLHNLPPLVPTNNVREQMLSLPVAQRHRVHRMPPGPDRWKERSRTFPGIAAAMASQWGVMVDQERAA